MLLIHIYVPPHAQQIMHRKLASDVLGVTRERQIFEKYGDDVYAYVHHVTVAVYGAAESGGTCKQCGQKGVQIEMKQTRSADEGMTAICTCTICGASWKV